MKRILVLDIGFRPGHNKTPIVSKIKAWRKAGCAITLLCTSEGQAFYGHQLPGIGCIIVRRVANPSNKCGLIFELLYRNLSVLFMIPRLRHRFDAVYSISSVLDLLLIPYVLKIFDRDIRWCVVFDNVVTLDRVGNRLINLLALLFFRISLVLLRKADAVFTITEDLRRALLKRGFGERRLILTGNAVETDLIRQAQRKAAYRIDALFLGRIDESKGVYDLLGALEIVKGTYPNFQLALVGRGNQASEERFKNEVQRRDLMDNVQLLGFKSGVEKYEIIKSSKLFLFLSPRESYGVALLEAVCCGLKAVVYDLDPYKSIYKNNEVTTVPRNDLQRAAAEVLRVMGDADFNNENGRHLLEVSSWDAIAATEMECFT